MHGGAIASLVDTAIAHSILLTPEYMEAHKQGGRIVSLDLRIKYLRPVSAGKIFCDARVTRLGRQIIHAVADVTDGEGKEVATGDSIYMLVAGDRLQKKTGLTWQCAREPRLAKPSSALPQAVLSRHTVGSEPAVAPMVRTQEVATPPPIPARAAS